MAYQEWAQFMKRGSKDKGRKEFFRNSETDVAEDMEEMKKEMDERTHATAERGQTIYARQGMPTYQWCMCSTCFDKEILEVQEEVEDKHVHVTHANFEERVKLGLLERGVNVCSGEGGWGWGCDACYENLKEHKDDCPCIPCVDTKIEARKEAKREAEISKQSLGDGADEGTTFSETSSGYATANEGSPSPSCT